MGESMWPKRSNEPFYSKSGSGSSDKGEKPVAGWRERLLKEAEETRGNEMRRLEEEAAERATKGQVRVDEANQRLKDSIEETEKRFPEL